MAAPSFSIDGPVPVAPRFGLLAAAQIVTGDDEHWLNGSTVRPYPLGPGHIHDECAVGSAAVKAIGADRELSSFGAYTVYVEDHCTARSVGDVAEFRARLLATLLAVEGSAVERELARGAGLGDDPHLTDTHLDQLHGGTATSPENALGLLERAIGDTGKQGLIHVDPQTFTSWAALNLVQASGSVMLTRRGTPVAVGNGYIDARPDGAGALAACLSWAFATGPVQIRRTEAFVNPEDISGALARATNDVSFYGERHYLHTWDRELQAGVLIDRSVSGCS
jgi:hypothetical protein